MLRYKPIQTLYDEIIDSLDLECITCEDCNHTGFNIHCYYTRNFQDNGCLTEILILRVICKSCGKTHAILLSNMIPYRKHSVDDNIKVISAVNNNEIKQLFKNMIITFMEECKAIKAAFRNNWEQRLISAGISLNDDLTDNCISSFGRQFMQIHCGRCFLLRLDHLTVS